MASSDTEQLHQLGYAQELRRGMRTFSNFAVSFTIISILSGCLTLFYFAMNTGGRLAGVTPPAMPAVDDTSFAAAKSRVETALGFVKSLTRA